MINQDQQAAFLKMLQEGYVLTYAEIEIQFQVKNAKVFVEQVRDRTGLDIYEGRVNSYKEEFPVYYMISDISPEAPGLDHMEDPLGFNETHVAISEVEYPKGYYIMWVCPNEIRLPGAEGVKGFYSTCGQFHKVDLGDEQLISPRNVRCIKCGKQYQVRPLSWR